MRQSVYARLGLRWSSWARRTECRWRYGRPDIPTSTRSIHRTARGTRSWKRAGNRWSSIAVGCPRRGTWCSFPGTALCPWRRIWRWWWPTRSRGCRERPSFARWCRSEGSVSATTWPAWTLATTTKTTRRCRWQNIRFWTFPRGSADEGSMTLSQVAKHQNFAPSLTESSAALSPGELHCYKTVVTTTTRIRVVGRSTSHRVECESHWNQIEGKS